MNKIFTKYIVVGIVSLLSCLFPQNIFAAELTFKIVPNIEANSTTTLVEVRVDPKSKKLNVVEGTIIFSGTVSDNLSVKIENGQSILSLWPTPPQYRENENAINFIGGVPDGFDQEGLLFRLLISSTSYGDLNISYVNGNAYLNDGKGTKEPIYSKTFAILIDKDGYNKMSETLPNFAVMIYVIIILLIVVAFIIYKYVHKKNI